MENPEHLAIIQKGVEHWNQWRKAHPEVRPDLGKANLNGANLIGANLTRANLYGANLKEAHLDGANLKEAYLYGANLKEAYLYGANLKEAYLYGVNLNGANLEGAHLEGAHLDGANLNGANLEGANLNGAHLEGADLRGAHLKEARFWMARLRGALWSSVIDSPLEYAKYVISIAFVVLIRLIIASACLFAVMEAAGGIGDLPLWLVLIPGLYLAMEAVVFVYNLRETRFRFSVK